MIALQMLSYLALFTGAVAFIIRGGAVNGLYFYPKPVRERAFAIGLADRAETARKRKRFFIWFPLLMLVALVFIIGVWNGVRDLKTAYLQTLLFLEVMNWYDGIVIDRLWVGHSKFWVLPGTEDLPFVKTWKEVLIKRTLGSAAYVGIAAAVALLVVWIF
ncbi:MAG: hypothetical protein Q4F83_01055 [Eubacteriales bacterium]|nr:hypothetical protein [Eubacteriales bacterium]